MRTWIVAAALGLSACGSGVGNVYPEEAKAEFEAQCQMGGDGCDCLWGKITRAMTHDEYEAAMARFETEGLMDPRVTSARTECLAGG